MIVSKQFCLCNKARGIHNIYITLNLRLFNSLLPKILSQMTYSAVSDLAKSIP